MIPLKKMTCSYESFLIEMVVVCIEYLVSALYQSSCFQSLESLAMHLSLNFAWSFWLPLPVAVDVDDGAGARGR